MNPPSRLLVIVQTVDGYPTSMDYEVLALARALTDRTCARGTVVACVLGHRVEDSGKDLVAHGADRVYIVDAELLADYQADAWLPDLVNIAGSAQPDAILAVHTSLSADLIPRLAFRLGSMAATGCIDASVDNGKLLLTRSCFGGKANEVISIVTSPALFTVKPKCFAPAPAQDNAAGEVVHFASVLDPTTIRTKLRGRTRDEGDGARLESANVVVAGGGGMKGPHGFELAAKLAELLGGAVGASRVACDLGWCPPSWQVGLSGKTVAPELYLAVGISGAGQHMAGCANSKTIVAINADADAQIFKFATYGIVADCHQLMPALIEQIHARNARANA